MVEPKPTLFGLDELGARRELPPRPVAEREPPPAEPRVVYEDAHVQLWHGRWQDVLPRLGQVDAVITDPPYSARVHDGHDAAAKLPDMRRELPYAPWTAHEVWEACDGWLGKTRGWLVAMSDHGLALDWEREAERHDRCTFAPLPFVACGSRVRLAGDGPSSWTIWITVSRPRTRDYAAWGTLPGAYVLPLGQGAKPLHTGGKPLWLMRELVRDYSRPGNVILDPCAGAGTTGRAAKDLGRRAILIEQDRRTCELAAKVLRPARAWQQELGTDGDAEVTHG
jgi:site-specific DNA-methyltransferase (adenine-specific)